MGDLSDFQRGQTDVARLAKTATTFAVPRAAVSKVMTAYKVMGRGTVAENQK
jgi:hypothetical protein